MSNPAHPPPGYPPRPQPYQQQQTTAAYAPHVPMMQHQPTLNMGYPPAIMHHSPMQPVQQWSPQQQQLFQQMQAQRQNALANQQIQHQMPMAPPVAPPPAPVQPQQSQTSSQSGSAQSPSSERGSTPQNPKARGGRGRAGPGRAAKKRKTIVASADSDDSGGEEFNTENVKTKSGRKVNRPVQFNPAEKTPSRRRGPYRRIYDARICKVCQRGHSPNSNMIVFCDGCNSPYHQLCHDPQIDDLVIQVEEAAWYCGACERQRERKELKFGLPGAALSEADKRAYLATLPVSKLVDIIFFCEKAHPELGIYDPNTKAIVDELRQKREQESTNGEDAPGEDDVNWEDMIVRAVAAIDRGKGSQPKVIFEWMKKNYPALEGRDVKNEAQGYLQSALRKNMLLKDGPLYRANPQNPFKDPQTAGVTPGLLAPGSGIRLPVETAQDELLVDHSTPVFSHISGQPTHAAPLRAPIVEDALEGLGGVGNGFY